MRRWWNEFNSLTDPSLDRSMRFYEAYKAIMILSCFFVPLSFCLCCRWIFRYMSRTCFYHYFVSTSFICHLTYACHMPYVSFASKCFCRLVTNTSRTNRPINLFLVHKSHANECTLPTNKQTKKRNRTKWQKKTTDKKIIKRIFICCVDRKLIVPWNIFISFLLPWNKNIDWN